MKFLEIFDTNKTARIFLNIYLVLNLLFMVTMGLVSTFVFFVSLAFTGSIDINSYTLFMAIAPIIVFVSTLVYFFTKNKKLLLVAVILSLPYYFVTIQGYISKLSN